MKKKKKKQSKVHKQINFSFSAYFDSKMWEQIKPKTKLEKALK